jgi:predicted MFS family arabinose efflux permease
VGIIVACVAHYAMSALPHRSVFLIGVLPALIVLWIRRAVPEPEEWREAQATIKHPPGIADLFRGHVRKITVLTILVCSLSLTAHWAFMYWYLQHLRNLPDVAAWSETEKNQLASTALFVVMIASILGNFLCGGIAKVLGYRKTISLMSLAYFASIFGGYCMPRPLTQIWPWLFAIGLCQGLFALFTMYLPPLFPTLLRTTGAGFSYNIGRIAAAAGTVFFGLFSQVGDYRVPLFYAGFLFIPTALVALAMPDLDDHLLSSNDDKQG